MSHLANTKLHFQSRVQPVLTFPTLCSSDLGFAGGNSQGEGASLLTAAGERQQHVSVLKAHFSSRELTNTTPITTHPVTQIAALFNF